MTHVSYIFDRMKEIHPENYWYLNKPDELLLPEFEYIGFMYLTLRRYSTLQTSIKRLYVSGIYARDMKLKKTSFIKAVTDIVEPGVRKRQFEDTEKSLSFVNSSIDTLFVISSFCLTLCIVVFVLEYSILDMAKFLRRGVRSCFGPLRYKKGSKVIIVKPKLL